MKDAELLIAYVWWEGQEGWLQILSEGNKWPANTDIATAWKMANTGNETGMFSVRFMDMESVGVQLSPGESAWVYLYPITPVDGVYQKKAEIVANGTVVAELSFKVTIGEAKEAGFPVLPLVLGGAVVAIAGIGIALSRRKR